MASPRPYGNVEQLVEGSEEYDAEEIRTERHGTATLLLAAGVPDAVLVQEMGHADTRILRRYEDVIPELMRDAEQRLEALLTN